MASLWIALIGLVSLYHSTSGQFGFGGASCTFDPKCYVYKSGCSLIDAFPFWRLTPSTCEQCLDLCQKKINGPPPFCCRSAVFDAVTQTCDLFGVPAGKMKTYNGRIYFQPTGAPGCASNNTSPAAAICKDGETAKLIAVEGYAVDSLNGKDVPNTDKDGCGKACLSGKLPDGSTIACKSALFKDGKCTLSTDDPKKEEDLKKTDGANYFHIHCYPNDLVKGCPDTFIEAPQKVLIGMNRLTVDKSSLDECIKACLTSEKDNGFACKSGIFYFKEGKLNCILNEESAKTKPDLFQPEDEFNEVYFELGCGGGHRYKDVQKKKTKSLKEALKDIPEVGPWTMWSHCHGKDSVQTRFRQCTKKDSRKCQDDKRSCNPFAIKTSTTVAPGKKDTDDKLIDNKRKQRQRQ